MRLLTFLVLTGLYSCAQSPSGDQNRIHPEAKKLNDSATTLVMETGDYEQALILLDKAIAIDSNYFLAYWNKLSFLSSNRLFDEALQTSFHLLRLKPRDPLQYMNTGMLYDMTGDSIAATGFYTKAALLYDQALDSIPPTDKLYTSLLQNKAVNLIMTGQHRQGNLILQELYKKAENDLIRESLAMILNKTKQEILNNLFSDNDDQPE